MARIWALILILICGFNAIGGSAEFLGNELSEHHSQAVSLVVDSHSPQEFQALTRSLQEHTGAHHDLCHLGHCACAVALKIPSYTVSIISTHRTFGWQALIYNNPDLTGPVQPPSA